MKRTDYHHNQVNQDKSCIPRLSRSSSLRYKGEKVLPPSYHCSKHDVYSMTAESPDLDELCSLQSFDSASIVSCSGETRKASMPSPTPTHQTAGNKKFVLHCQHQHQTPEHYLTPTQRKDKQIKQLQSFLKKANKDCKEKEEQIKKLSRDLEDLKLRVTQSVPLSDAHSPVIGEENDSTTMQAGSSDTTLQSGQEALHASPEDKQADSGILEDHSQPQTPIPNAGAALPPPTLDRATFQKLLNLFYAPNTSTTNDSSIPPCEEQQFPSSMHQACSMSSLGEDLKYHAEIQHMKEKYNSKIEALLQSLSEANARYMDLQPAYERAQDKIRMLEAQVEVLKQELKNQEDWHSQMYLKMYKKGQEAAKFEHADEVLEFAHQAPKRVSVPELLQQLHRKEQELEATKDLYRAEVSSHQSSSSMASGLPGSQPDYTLRFLKDAMYYFLTERENKEHLHAIQSILGFSEKERQAVSKSMKYRRFFMQLPTEMEELGNPTEYHL